MSLKLFLLSAIHLLRMAIPSKLVRMFVVAFVFIVVIGAIVLGIFLGIHPPPQWRGDFRSDEFVKNLSGLFFLLISVILIMPTLITIRSALKLLSMDEAVNLINTAPISPISKFWSTIGPIIFFSSVPYFIILTPFIILFLFLDPLISIVTILYFIIVSAWSVVLSLLTVVLSIDFLGKKSANRLSYAFPFILYLLSTSFIYAIEDFRSTAPIIGQWQLVFLALSLLLLPALFKETTKSFYFHLVNSVEPLREYAPPKWGIYNPWDYIDRKASNWSMLPLIIFIGLMISRVYEVPMLHEGIVSMLLFSFVINPIKVIMSNERENPIRWALAPFADRIKKMIWIKVNLPLILITSLTLIYFGHSHFLWLGSNLIIITFAIVATMDDWLGQKPLLSGILHNILPILCLSSQLLW
jgi:hypothetical protein